MAMLQILGREYNKRGFSVVELAIVLVIIGLLLLIVGSGIASYIDISNRKTTNTNLQTIERALENYKETFGRLPCPADPTKDIRSDADYGTEVAGCEPNTCTDWGAPAIANSKCLRIEDGGSELSNIIRGMVPVTTLGLSELVSLDGYGNKITYAMERSQANLLCSSNGHTEKSIIILDTDDNIAQNKIAQPSCFSLTGSPPIVSDVIDPADPISKIGSPAFLLISHGENESGGWTKGGDQIACITSDTDFYDDENCDNDAIFTESLFSDQDTQRFDDQLLWSYIDTASICPAGVDDCVAWLDAADRCSIGIDSSTDEVLYLQDKLTRYECGDSVDSFITPSGTRPLFSNSGSANSYNNLPTISFETQPSAGQNGDHYLDYEERFLADTNFEYYFAIRPVDNVTALTESTGSSGTACLSGTGTQHFLTLGATSFLSLSDSLIHTSVGTDNINVCSRAANGSYFVPRISYNHGLGSVPMLVRVKVENNIATLYVNGELAEIGVTPTNPETAYLQFDTILGSSFGNYNFEGDFFEMLAYDKVLTDAEAAKVSRYLKDKWNIQ